MLVQTIPSQSGISSNQCIEYLQVRLIQFKLKHWSTYHLTLDTFLTGSPIEQLASSWHGGRIGHKHRRVPETIRWGMHLLVGEPVASLLITAVGNHL